MRCFDVTLKGFCGDTDQTDHLVKWIVAPDVQIVNNWLRENGLTDFLHEPPRDMGDYASDYGFADGVDIILDDTGRIADITLATEWKRQSLKFA